jgi:NAD(P)-dependent dehydrogenase (short-subunit alcohol dehydrogenase family)
MTQSEKGATQPGVEDVALIVGGGPGVSASCAKRFAENGMRVGIAARIPRNPSC